MTADRNLNSDQDDQRRKAAAQILMHVEDLLDRVANVDGMEETKRKIEAAKTEVLGILQASEETRPVMSLNPSAPWPHECH